VANINLSGYANVVGNVTAGNLIGTNLNVSATSNLGGVANVKITGGTNGYYLQTDGTGNLTWNEGTYTWHSNSVVLILKFSIIKATETSRELQGLHSIRLRSNVMALGNIVAVANVVGGNLTTAGQYQQ